MWTYTEGNDMPTQLTETFEEHLEIYVTHMEDLNVGFREHGGWFFTMCENGSEAIYGPAYS